MKLITSATALAAAFRAQLESCSKFHFAVAWASVGFPEFDALVASKQKIGLAVVGTHFYQTAPEFIATFTGHQGVRFVTDHSGVFHPKLYLFEREDGGRACIIGSANFTGGGFGHNQEASLLISSADDPTGLVFSNARDSIDRFWTGAVPGKDIDLDHYREMRKRFEKPLAHAAGQFGTGEAGRPIENVDMLTLSWETFLSKVREDKNHEIDRRLEVLAQARNLFDQYGHLARMPIGERQGIAGFRESGDIPWGWFGSMRGAGEFKKLVNRNPRGLSLALDQIPLEGVVMREDYLAFAERFVEAFPLKDGKPTRHGLGTATRLLAMKRPDFFVCLDGANRRRLLDDFEINVPRHDYVGYWDKIIERVKLATWWNTRRPVDPVAGRVWDGRAAMLDAIYYAP